jgi:trehalose 6-phosphate phosphatase
MPRMPMSERELQREQFFAKLEERRSGALALDYDGTLAPFQKDRFAAVPYAGVRDLVARIMATGRTRVVLISGRQANEVQALLGLAPSPEIWGAHGLQRLRPDGSCETAAMKDSDLKLLNEAGAWLEHNGLSHLAEIKPGSIAVHWRGMPLEESDGINGKVRAAWVPLAARGEMSLLEFDGGIELRMSGHDKGRAVLTVLQELAPGTPFAFLGDDATDEDAFVALQGSGALTVLVRPEWRESNAEIWIRPPEELLEFLQEWLERSGGEQ